MTDPRMEEIVEAVARAIDKVQLFSRRDDIAQEIEVCRYGEDGEDDIVVVSSFQWFDDEAEALHAVVRSHRARAAVATVLEKIAEADEGQWTAGRDPIMARDMCKNGWHLADHVKAAFSNVPAWAEPDIELKGHITKGDCAAMVWRAMINNLRQRLG